MGLEYSPGFKALVVARLKRLSQGDPLYYASEKMATAIMLGVGIMVLAEWLDPDCVTINTKRRALAAKRRE